MPDNAVGEHYRENVPFVRNKKNSKEYTLSWSEGMVREA